MMHNLLVRGVFFVALGGMAQAQPISPVVSSVKPAAIADVQILEPQLHIEQGGSAAPQVALTLDACMGKIDYRILNVLVEHKIPTTLFVTGRWLQKNAGAFAIIKAHPDLFDVENHGAMHVPAITSMPTMYHIKTAGSLDAVRTEIAGGEKAIIDAGAPKPLWYRDATARYSTDAIELARSMGYQIAGYSLNGDMGASLPASDVERRIAAAKDGDVIISHINQPTRPSGAGVAEGILALQAKGMKFVRLKDVKTTSSPNPVPDRDLHEIPVKPATQKIK